MRRRPLFSRPDSSRIHRSGIRASLQAILAILLLLAPAMAQPGGVDGDADGVPDPSDNCSEVANPDQRDSDADGFGNACDADYDNDGIVGGSDFGIFGHHFGRSGPLTDHDGDGITGGTDFGIFMAAFGRPPGPGATGSPEEKADGTLLHGWIDGRTFYDRPVLFEDVDGKAVFEGDIILGRTDDLIVEPAGDVSGAEDGVGSTTAYSIVISGDRYRWPDGVVPYRISPNLSDTLQTRVVDAIAHWEAKTPIDFVPVTSTNLSDYDSYVQFIKADEGCSAEIGRRGGWQDINLSSGCSKGNVIHEIGHAVGLWHEQSREDRDDYVEIKYENIEEDKEHNFDQHISDGDDIGSYDYASVMHYPRDAFSKNGNDTIVPVDSNAMIGQRSGLSDGDIAAIQQIYGTLYPAWLVSWAGTGKWTTLEYSKVGVNDLGFGDFDGDGRTDVFRANPSKGAWYVSWGGQSKWEVLNSSGVGLDGLRFGDFDGDGRTDVFRASGGQWKVSFGGSGKWTKVNASNVSMSSLRFGDFDGDGRTDVFRISGTTWYVSYGAATGWTALNSSIVPIENMRFEDFDGDGRTDIFKESGDVWYVSYGGATRWTAINSSIVPFENLRFGDFDGDGRADVFKTIDGTWYVSYGGTTRWTELNTSGVPITSLRFGDFDGDGRTDVFRAGKSY